MSEDFAHKVVLSLISQTCQYVGWNSATKSSLDIFSDIFERYIQNMGKTLKSYAELDNRTLPLLEDASLTFKSLGISIQDLNEYILDVPSFPFVKIIPTFPFPKSTNLQIPEEADLKNDIRPDYIPDYFPLLNFRKDYSNLEVDHLRIKEADKTIKKEIIVDKDDSDDVQNIQICVKVEGIDQKLTPKSTLFKNTIDLQNLSQISDMTHMVISKKGLPLTRYSDSSSSSSGEEEEDNLDIEEIQIVKYDVEDKESISDSQLKLLSPFKLDSKSQTPTKRKVGRPRKQEGYNDSPVKSVSPNDDLTEILNGNSHVQKISLKSDNESPIKENMVIKKQAQLLSEKPMPISIKAKQALGTTKGLDMAKKNITDNQSLVNEGHKFNSKKDSYESLERELFSSPLILPKLKFKDDNKAENIIKKVKEPDVQKLDRYSHKKRKKNSKSFTSRHSGKLSQPKKVLKNLIEKNAQLKVEKRNTTMINQNTKPISPKKELNSPIPLYGTIGSTIIDQVSSPQGTPNYLALVESPTSQPIPHINKSSYDVADDSGEKEIINFGVAKSGTRKAVPNSKKRKGSGRKMRRGSSSKKAKKKFLPKPTVPDVPQESVVFEGSSSSRTPTFKDEYGSDEDRQGAIVSVPTFLVEGEGEEEVDVFSRTYGTTPPPTGHTFVTVKSDVEEVGFPDLEDEKVILIDQGVMGDDYDRGIMDNPASPFFSKARSIPEDDDSINSEKPPSTPISDVSSDSSHHAIKYEITNASTVLPLHGSDVTYAIAPNASPLFDRSDSLDSSGGENEEGHVTDGRILPSPTKSKEGVHVPTPNAGPILPIKIKISKHRAVVVKPPTVPRPPIYTPSASSAEEGDDDEVRGGGDGDDVDNDPSHRALTAKRGPSHITSDNYYYIGGNGSTGTNDYHNNDDDNDDDSSGDNGNFAKITDTRMGDVVSNDVALVNNVTPYTDLPLPPPSTKGSGYGLSNFIDHVSNYGGHVTIEDHHVTSLGSLSGGIPSPHRLAGTPSYSTSSSVDSRHLDEVNLLHRRKMKKGRSGGRTVSSRLKPTIKFAPNFSSIQAKASKTAISLTPTPKPTLLARAKTNKVGPLLGGKKRKRTSGQASNVPGLEESLEYIPHKKKRKSTDSEREEIDEGDETSPHPTVTRPSSLPPLPTSLDHDSGTYRGALPQIFSDKVVGDGAKVIVGKKSKRSHPPPTVVMVTAPPAISTPPLCTAPSNTATTNTTSSTNRIGVGYKPTKPPSVQLALAGPTYPYTGVQRTVITETLGSAVVSDSGDKIWICPACTHPDDGSPMIGCDTCDDWYHWICVNITEPPDENENWYCSRCLAKRLTSKKKKRKKR